MTGSAVAWVSLGSNLGRRGDNLRHLRTALEATSGLRIVRASAEVLTRSVGLARQPDYHNQVVLLRSDRPLSPASWLELCRRAEIAAGRRPTYRWGPRRADADILLLGERGEVRAAGGAPDVPHARLGERPFLCALLAELAPDLMHPDGWRIADRAPRRLR